MMPLPVSLAISWYNCLMSNEIRYLGLFIVHSQMFRCSLERAKKSFYRAANAVFAKNGGVASEKVTF